MKGNRSLGRSGSEKRLFLFWPFCTEEGSPVIALEAPFGRQDYRLPVALRLRWRPIDESMASKRESIVSTASFHPGRASATLASKAASTLTSAFER
ncbi:MAG: hypothetical protein EHM80_16755 [Nitrospiraceae bacterium]|nr:MAG: hypothetical protein EHM80_16755 [Nitrospiraceae bacterium]